MFVLRFLPFLVLLLVLLAGAWWRGLYFEEDQMAVIFFLLASAVLGILVNYSHSIRAASYQQFVVFLLPAVLLLSSVNGVSPQKAQLAWLQFLALAGVFVVVKRNAANQQWRTVLQAVLLIAISAICAFGLLAKGGLADFPAAVTKGRVGSVFQYPNAFGMLAGAGLLGSLALLSAGKHPLRNLALASVPLLLYGLVFSFSRGAWLLFFPVFGFLVWLQPKTERATFFWRSGFALLPAALLLPLVHWSFVFPFALVAVIGFAAWASWYAARFWQTEPAKWSLSAKPAGKYASPFWQGITRQKRAFGAFMGVVLLLGGITVARSVGITERIKAVSATDSSFTARLTFYQDASCMFLDYPLTGAGGGAWPTLYQSYQSQPYFSTQVHNFLLQLLTDSGILGIVVFGFVLALLFTAAVRNNRNATGQDKTNSSFFLAVAAMILLHSLLDFDLSYFYLAIVPFTALAAANPAMPEPEIVTESQRKTIVAGAVLTGVVLVWLGWAGVVAARQVMAIQENKTGNKLASAGHYAHALVKFESAAKLAPSHLGYRQAVASVKEALARQYQNTEQLQESKVDFERLSNTEPLNPATHQALAQFYVRNGNLSRAYQEQYKAWQLAPYNWHQYEDFLELAGKAARADSLNQASARKALEVYVTLASRRQVLKQRPGRLRRKFNHTESMHLAAAQLAYQLSDFDYCAELAARVQGSPNQKAQQLANAYILLCAKQQSSLDTAALASRVPQPERQLAAIRQLPKIK